VYSVPTLLTRCQVRLVPSVVSARCSPLRFCRRICLEATTVEIETLTPRLVSTVAWFLSG
jgi:hypothetical protein